MEISVDDFGSGYSSLNLLSKVAVDTVKLDKQFLDAQAAAEPTAQILNSDAKFEDEHDSNKR